ncbi:MAG: hypothetical protein RIS48_2356, partial [Pseudomonadota bacterium]
MTPDSTLRRRCLLTPLALAGLFATPTLHAAPRSLRLG